METDDRLGRRVLAAEVGLAAAGVHTIPLETSRLAPGVHVVRVTAGTSPRHTV